MEGVGEIGSGCGVQGAKTAKMGRGMGEEGRLVWRVEIEVDVAGQEKCEVRA